MEDVEITLTRSRLIRWLGHVSKMNNDRPVKILLYGELDNGIRPAGRPKLQYKDTCKNILKSGGALVEWHAAKSVRPELPLKAFVKDSMRNELSNIKNKKKRNQSRGAR